MSMTIAKALVKAAREFETYPLGARLAEIERGNIKSSTI